MDLRDGTSPIDGVVHRANMAFLTSAAVCTNFDTFRQRAPGLGIDGSEDFTLVTNGTNCPRCVIVQDRQRKNLLVVSSGIATIAQAGSILFGWSQHGAQYTNAYPFIQASNFLSSEIPGFAGNAKWNKVRLVGHSFGGAVCQHLHKRFNRETETGMAVCYTYGSPKPDYRTNRNEFPQSNVVRVFQDQDPVPNLPPSIEELAGYWRLLRNTEAIAWNRFIQMNDGYVVWPDGRMESAFNPTMKSTISYFQTLAAWITGITAFGADVHSLASYERAMQLVPEVLQFDPNWRSGRSHTPNVSLTGVQMEERRVQDMVVQGNAAAGDPIGAARQAAPFVAIRSGLRFYPGRRNRRLAVLYDGEVVTFVRTKRARKQIVRWLNDTQLAS